MGVRLIIASFFSWLGMKLFPNIEPELQRRRGLATALFIVSIILMIASLFVGCATVNQKLDPQINYRRDIQLEINGQKFDGVAVPKPALKYEIKIKSAGKIDMLTIQSCHRHDKFEDVGGLLSSGKSFTYVYEPIKGIEDGDGCLLDIGVFEKKAGRHGWATIDFERKIGVENLPAVIECDGKQWNSDPMSVSVCQAKAGTIQKIKFDHRVKVSPDERCKVMTTGDELTYTFLMPAGECTYYFGDKYGNFHRFTAIGYESILIRDF